MIVRRALVVPVLLAGSACGPSATEANFDSANPAARLYAIEKAARTGDVSARRQLVEQLDSDDPLVRMLAIDALARLSGGETHGYRFDDPPWEREPAIDAWVKALDGTAGAAGPHSGDSDG